MQAESPPHVTQRSKSPRVFRPALLDELLDGNLSHEHLFGPGGLLQQLTGAIVNRALKAEMDTHLDTEQAETEGPNNRRNGFSSKQLDTEQGPVALQIPRDRHSTFEPQLVPKHQRRILGLDEKILSLYARGMSTREIQAQFAEMYDTDISATLVSNVTGAVHEEIVAWQSRPLASVYPVLWLDGLYVKVRDGGVVENKVAYLVIGLTLEGRKQILGLWLESNEGAKVWLRVLSELKNRGVEDVFIACCDGLKGFPEAIEAAFPKAVVQTCVVHQVRQSLAFVPFGKRKEVAADLRAIYTADSEETAKAALQAFEAKWSKEYPLIGLGWRRNWTRLVPFLQFPQEIRRMVYTTNVIESLNSSLRRLIRNKGHFPSDEAARKLLYLGLRRIEASWRGGSPTWRQIFNQLVIHFGDRIPSEAIFGR